MKPRQVAKQVFRVLAALLLASPAFLFASAVTSYAREVAPLDQGARETLAFLWIAVVWFAIGLWMLISWMGDSRERRNRDPH